MPNEHVAGVIARHAALGPFWSLERSKTRSRHCQAQNILTQISKTIELHPEIAGQPILLTSPTARRHLFKLTNRFLPQVVVLSHNEISTDAQIQAVGLVEI